MRPWPGKLSNATNEGKEASTPTVKRTKPYTYSHLMFGPRPVCDKIFQKIGSENDQRGSEMSQELDQRTDFEDSGILDAIEAAL